MDAMGHVNNTLYFRYLEIVRIEWLHRVGAAPDPKGHGVVIVNTFCNFLKQLEYPGDILAKHYVADPGRTSFNAFVTLERTDDPGVIYAEGGAKTVWVDFPNQKSAPLPDWLRTLLE
jgi:acyl-CoA thioester hydrolase